MLFSRTLSSSFSLASRPSLATRFLAIAALLAAVGCEDGPPGEPETPNPEPIEMDTAAYADENGLATTMVCPGANGCTAVEGRLRAGAAARVITPLVEEWTDENGDNKYNFGEPFVDLNGNNVLDPVYLAGFDVGRQANGIHDDQWARVLVLEKGDLKIALVALDLVGLFAPDIYSIRVAVEDLGFDHVVVSSTHVHEVMDTMGLWGKDVGTTGRDPAYIETLVELTREAVEEANAGLTEVTATYTQPQAAHLIDDSRLPEVKDPTITAIRFTSLEDDLVIAHWIAFGNHPEALSGDNQLVTSDYPHYVRTVLEEAHPGSLAIFHAGLLGGLMNPLHIQGCPDANGNETCPSGTFELAEYIGTEIANLALEGLDNAPIDLDTDSIELGFKRGRFFLPVDNFTFLLAFQLGLISRGVYLDDGETYVAADRISDLSLEELSTSGLQLGTEVSIVHLGVLDIISIPGELYPELFLVGDQGEVLIEQPAGGDFPDAALEVPVAMSTPAGRIAVPLNNAGDSLGYMIPLAQFDREVPRAYEDDGQYGEENSVGPRSGPAVVEAAHAVYALEVK